MAAAFALPSSRLALSGSALFARNAIRLYALSRLVAQTSRTLRAKASIILGRSVKSLAHIAVIEIGGPESAPPSVSHEFPPLA